MSVGPSGSTREDTGNVAGVKYIIQVPANWNHDFLLFSYGSNAPDEPPQDASDNVTEAWLLGHGYAIGGTSYGSQKGYTVLQGEVEQKALLDHFVSTYGKPRRIFAWGQSLGGLITARLLEDYPLRFAGGMPLCGGLAGGPAHLDLRFDGAFVFKTLLMPSLDLLNVSDPATTPAVGSAIEDAQSSPAGTARLDLAMVILQLPPWYGADQPAPVQSDYIGREKQRYYWMQQENDALLQGIARGNQGVDYGRLLDLTGDRSEVESLYRRAGLDLNADLARLAAARRYSVSEAVVRDVTERELALSGAISAPVLSVHTIADPLVPVAEEAAYATTVGASGKSELLRQAFVQRAGHCVITAAETIAAFQALVRRVDTGQWTGVSAGELNLRATTLKTIYDHYDAAFVSFSPQPLARPYDTHSDDYAA